MTRTPTGRYVSTTIHNETVNAFVPDPLPPKLKRTELRALDDSIRAADVAIEKLRIAGQMIPSVDWLIYSFVRKEALLSLEIEGTQATLEDVLSFEQTGQVATSDVADVEEVTNYVKAVNYAFSELKKKRGLPISIRLVNECHRRLMQGVRGETKQPGEIRRSPVWIGGRSATDSVFVPPPHDQLADLLSALEKYIHNDDELPVFLRIAAVHVQFETIHPYLDGNGRIGRMLIALLLAHWGVLAEPLLYLSVYFKSQQQTYYDHLNAVRTEGDWSGWFQFFLKGVREIADDAARTASKLYRQVAADRKTLLEAESMTVSALQLFEMLPEHPVISMPLVTKLLQTTKPTASKAIELLRNNGVITEIGLRKRDRVYRYDRYLANLR